MKLQLPINPNRWDKIQSWDYVFEFQQADRIIPVMIWKTAKETAKNLKRKMKEMEIDVKLEEGDYEGEKVPVIVSEKMIPNMTAVNNNLIE